MGRRSKVDFDSYSYRKNIWELEYSKSKDLPSSNTLNPSSSLRNFLSTYHGEKKSAVDIGSGNGRNCIFLSQNGFKNILGIELSTNAYKQSLDNTKDHKNISIVNSSIESGIPLPDGSVDLVIDMMSMHSFTKAEREVAFREIKRVLKDGGSFLFFTLERKSPAARELIKKWKGSEPGSYRFKIDGVVHSEKTFTRNELDKELSPLKIVSWNETAHDTKAFGNVYTRVYIYGVAQKS